MQVPIPECPADRFVRIMHSPIGLTADRTSAMSGCRTQAGGLPFAHLNLRRNPFGELKPAERAALAVAEVDRIVAGLHQSDYAVQFIGEAGRGKTTHLLAVMRHFPQAVYIHVCPGQRPRIPHGRPLLIDECQRVPRRQRQRVYRRGVPLALGTHQDLGDELGRAGFRVDTVLPAQMLNAHRLRRILNRRIVHVRRCPGPVPQVRIATAGQLIERFGENIRAIESSLYDLFQELPGIQDV